LYPLLKRMECNGWLRGKSDSDAGPRAPRYYRLTPRGREVLKVALAMLRELHGEVAGSSLGRVDLARFAPARRRAGKR
jgi:DNA-binding PadR family transcriptional regulator